MWSTIVNQNGGWFWGLLLSQTRKFSARVLQSSKRLFCPQETARDLEQVLGI